jgi:YD repeat-containing protein
VPRHPLLLARHRAFAYDAVGNRTTGGTVVNTGNQLTADANHTRINMMTMGISLARRLLATGNYSSVHIRRRESAHEGSKSSPPGIRHPLFTTSTYRYDGLGRRIEKVANGQTKRYVYDGEDILLEYDGANTLQAKYTHGPGIDANRSR